MPQNTNILHLTDLHYTKKDEYNQKVVLDALLTDISKLTDNGLKPDIIIFSGDLVKVADEEDVYFHFFDNVLEPILKKTKCSESNLVITPGNHDIHRSHVEKTKPNHIGLRSSLKNRDFINEEYLKGNLNAFIESKFTGFNSIKKFLNQDKVIYSDGYLSVTAFPEFKTTVLEFNTSWMGGAGVDGLNDNRALLIPEAAISKAIAQLPLGGLGQTILVTTHHPINWLVDENETDFLQTIHGRYSIHFHGHMHEPLPSAIASFKGTGLTNQGGALYTHRTRYCGYSLLRIGETGKNKEIHLRTYYDSRREFDIAIDRTKNGIFYPDSSSESYFSNHGNIINPNDLNSWRQDALYPAAYKDFNEGLTDKLVADIFVSPPLYAEVEYEDKAEQALTERVEKSISFEEVCTSNTNYVFYGQPEYGKTTLLKQLALSTLSKPPLISSHSIVAYIEFQSISRGDDKIEKLIRNNIPRLPNGMSLPHLLQEGFFTILIDDVVVTDLVKCSLISQFITLYPKNRYIFSSVAKRSDRYLNPLTNFPVKFERVFIESFRRSDMRSLVEKWDNDKRLNQEDVLNRLLTEMRNMNVPLTAINGTILLSIFESKSTNYAPINRATLIGKFIEILLEKPSLNELLRKQFDFQNRVHYLSHIAAHMVKNNDYVISEESLLVTTNQYLKDFGLPQIGSSLIAECHVARIFIKREENRVSFRYRAFLEYFIATRMNDDSSFKEWVIDEERYLSFVNEIGYYTSIARTDANILKILGERFEIINNQLYEELKQTPDLNSLDSFKLPDPDDTSEELVEAIERQINAPAFTDAERDEIMEADLPRDVEGRQEVFRPQPKELGARLFTSLVIYSNAVRNLELIPDELKREHLTKSLEAWARFLILSLWLVPNLAKHRQLKINGVTYNVSAPKHYSEAQIARLIYLDLPNAFSKLVWHTLGTEKLHKQIAEPVTGDVTEPGIIQFLRHALAMDLRLEGWPPRLSKFINYISNNRYLLQATLWKSNELHSLGGLEANPKSLLRNAMGTMVATLRGGSKQSQSTMKSQHVRKLERADLFKLYQSKIAPNYEPPEKA